MRIVRYRTADGDVRVGLDTDGRLLRLACPGIAALLAGDLERCRSIVAAPGEAETGPVELLAPVDGATEVWAAGVTYLRSRDARIEESHEPDVYDRVYAAERPELFFKSPAWRVRGPGETISVRADSTVDVPEPELALVLTATGEIAGYTICDDVSSRSIEGDNPLYLPQAKIYNGSCALGPAIVPSWAAPGTFGISLTVRRAGAVAFTGTTSTAQLARPLPDLARWLYAELDFPAGAVLSTGTGIVPGLDFTLAPGDEVSIEIPGIGTLTNPVVRNERLC
ncbi:fumarylacetoacetate hydrolase family protein [Hamadaea tsunoensis]|uniref:fumarylacetoacetate hydrolase family protein n=1 Tax=Hamadaea tsunoensis TaxID=53368 RepID=UPI0004815AC3|nr:fumarylacetoacetate hydrolase family protein [Hamadaea tsunoensis]